MGQLDHALAGFITESRRVDEHTLGKPSRRDHPAATIKDLAPHRALEPHALAEPNIPRQPLVGLDLKLRHATEYAQKDQDAQPDEQPADDRNAVTHRSSAPSAHRSRRSARA